MSSRAKDVIFLLGAGASAEAGIPPSAKMIFELEAKLRSEWQAYRDLYNHVKSAILYKEGLAGRFDASAYNIETLVNTLYELERNEEHPLYPFISAWNSRFVSLAGDKLGKVQEFRYRILEVLKDWMCPVDPTDGDYYVGLKEVQKTLNFPLRVFSLNYDLCVERLATTDFSIETGFTGYGPKHEWSYERFMEAERAANDLPQVFLYKLHGSIDWIRNPQTTELSRVEQIQKVQPNEMEIIFGREFKLEAADPYLFYIYEFRQYALEARLLVAVGYGFLDIHINKILSQAMKAENSKRLLVVADIRDVQTAEKRRKELADKLQIADDRIVVLSGTAKSFFREPNLGGALMDKIPPLDSPF